MPADLPEHAYFADSVVVKALAVRKWQETKTDTARVSMKDKKKELEQIVEALEGFDWQHTEPQRLKPYKPKYNITMGEKYLVWTI